MQFIEETPRLILKVENEDKAQDILDFYLRNRDHISPFEPQVSDSFYTLTYQQKMLDYEFQQIMKGTTIRYYIYLKSDPTNIIGSVNLTGIVHGPFCKAVLGYKLDQSMVGYGYASEAVTHLLSLAANDLKLHRIEAHVVTHNQPSIRLLNNIGFRYEGIEYQSTKVDGQWQDLLRYSLILN